LSAAYCRIAPGHPVHGLYHDGEYGFPTSEESVLFERLILEINQAGLSWLTILRKREAFTKAFAGFDGVWDVMRTAREVHEDPQAIANGYLPRTTDAKGNEFALAASPVQFDEVPLNLVCAPGHGEHTDALLAELGFSEDEIIEFKINSVVL